MARINAFRFSTKYQDDETDLLYYGYRYYGPSTGRWLCKDPIQESGGMNLYAFVHNNPVSVFDALGTTMVTSPTPFPGQNPKEFGPYVKNFDDGFPDHVRPLRTLTEPQLLAAEKKVVQKLAQKCHLLQLWPKDEGTFDETGFFAGYKDREYYLYNGQVYADNEINYFGIGMYEAWAGDTITVADLVAYLWKHWQYNGQDPSPGTTYWLHRGFGDYTKWCRPRAFW